MRNDAFNEHASSVMYSIGGIVIVVFSNQRPIPKLSLVLFSLARVQKLRIHVCI